MSSVPEWWIPHRRSDGEIVGWIDMDSCPPLLVPYDRLGRAMEPVEDWLDAERVLDDLGLMFLTGTFLHGGQVVRIRHIDDTSVVVTTAVTDAVGDVGTEIRLPFPPGDHLTVG